MANHSQNWGATLEFPKGQVAIYATKYTPGKTTEASQIAVAYTKEGYSDAMTTARLIAASPELLEACCAALHLLKGSGFTDNQPTLIALKAAIAKAEGTDAD